MPTLESVKATLARHLPELKQRYPIARLALFGSITRDDFDPERSDIDIMVEFNGEIGWEYFDLCFFLQGLFPERKVDIVPRGAIQKHYWQIIAEDLAYV